MSSSAEFSYVDLRDKYIQFQYPIIVLTINNTDIAATGYNLAVTDVRVENSVGYEAGFATFKVAGTWDDELSCFKSTIIEKYLPLGAGVSIAAGYSNNARTIFLGYISKLNYVHKRGDVPGVVVTCMDMKGLMMSGTYSKQLTGVTCYSEAVTQIFEKYQSNLKSLDTPALTSVIVEDTPDKQDSSSSSSGDSEETAKTIEMQDESDYEFVVKVAKKFNYEFLVSAGTVAFRAAKSNEDLLMDMDFAGFKTVDIEQNLTGQVEKVEVRALNAGTGERISSSVKKDSSTCTKTLKKLISGTTKVYLDPTCDDTSELELRANYLLEENAYKFVTLKATTVGLPEFTAGRFIQLRGLHDDGGAVQFYLQQVVHRFDGINGYETDIIGRAKTLEEQS